MVSGTFSQRLVLGQGFLECDSATGLRLQGQAYWQLTIDKLTRSLGQTQEIEPHQSSNFPTQRCLHGRHSPRPAKAEKVGEDWDLRSGRLKRDHIVHTLWTSSGISAKDLR